MCNKIFVFLCILVLSINSALADHLKPPHNFRQAKIMAKQIFLSTPITIYSGCSFDALNEIDFTSCTFQPQDNIARDHKIEYEHMMPMSQTKNYFSCWTNKLCSDNKGHAFKGRKCCQLIDPAFSQLEAELYNLWPEIGSINNARSSFAFAEFNSIEKKRLGKYRNCILYIDFHKKLVEPRNSAKGIVARANLFVAKKYNIKLSKSQLKLFQNWNKKYPPTKLEIAWAKRVAAIEGYENQFISNWKRDPHVLRNFELYTRTP